MATTTSTEKTTAKDVKAKEAELDKPANIPAATEFSTSGAPRQVTDFDPSHPAVDDNPRKDTSIKQNRIDFNDPGLTAEEAVIKNLKEGGSGVAVEGSDAPAATKKD